LVLGGAKLIAIHKTRYYKRPDGLALGPGPFITALEYASGKQADVVGKPDRLFYESVQSQLNCPLSETVMIGDVGNILNNNFRLAPVDTGWLREPQLSFTQ
jgi:ribonucleotide monophosphatase NagD (HAD superfamily)